MKKTLELIKPYLPQILGIIGILLGGSSMGYTSSTENDSRDIRYYTGQQLADLMIEVEVLRKKVEQLEGHH